MAKTSRRRCCLVSREVEEMRWKLATGKISFGKYEKWRKTYNKTVSKKDRCVS